jgi:hypothetical protein
MAVWTVKSQNELGNAFVLAPERYDPRRLLGSSAKDDALTLGHVVKVIRQTVTTATAGDGPFLVLDTSHAHEGTITRPKQTVKGSDIGSAKKVAGRRDVIISRLRPYLRQVAFVDDEIISSSDDVKLICSTEFFILRSIDNRSIAFLVPFLLSSAVQTVLAASQEGGHHPRFDEATLLSLPIPAGMLEKRDSISEAVERSIKLYREAEKIMADKVREAGQLFNKMAC